MKNKKLILTTLLSGLFLTSSVEAGYTIHNGKFINSDYAAIFPADKHFELGQEAMAAKDMGEAARQFSILTTCFPNSPYGQEAYFYLGVAEFYLREFDFSNNAFTQYLKCKSNPQYFIQAIEYKFQIAERLRCGAKRRFCGSKQFPKWATGRTLALKIYDEVIAAMPSSEIAARALYSKGYLLWSIGEYRDCIDSFQLITKRFPKSDLTPQCYLLVGQVYYDMCVNEPQNPDILAFADLNARKFKNEFPKNELVEAAEYCVQCIKELYAGGLYDTACFYEKVCKPNAAIIYYYSAIKEFPDTQVAVICKERLAVLDPEYDESLFQKKEDQTDV